MLRLRNSPNREGRTINHGSRAFKASHLQCTKVLKLTMTGKLIFTTISCILHFQEEMKTGLKLMSQRSMMRSKSLLLHHGYSKPFQVRNQLSNGRILLNHWLKDWISWSQAHFGMNLLMLFVEALTSLDKPTLSSTIQLKSF